jgi:DNA-binding CsgD family transcriptional regulator
VLESGIPIEIPRVRRTLPATKAELALAVLPAGVSAVATLVRGAPGDSGPEKRPDVPLAENEHADELVAILGALMDRVQLLMGEARRETARLRDLRKERQRELEIQRSRRAELLTAIQRATVIQKLTPREMQVFALVAKGMTNVQFGELLSISSRTVETHRGHLMQKLDLTDFRELIVLATAYGYT